MVNLFVVVITSSLYYTCSGSHEMAKTAATTTTSSVARRPADDASAFPLTYAGSSVSVAVGIVVVVAGVDDNGALRPTSATPSSTQIMINGIT